MLTNIFFIFALVLSLFFASCFLILFICYLVIFNKVNRNFKVVKHD